MQLTSYHDLEGLERLNKVIDDPQHRFTWFTQQQHLSHKTSPNRRHTTRYYYTRRHTTSVAPSSQYYLYNSCTLHQAVQTIDDLVEYMLGTYYNILILTMRLKISSKNHERTHISRADCMKNSMTFLTGCDRDSDTLRQSVVD